LLELRGEPLVGSVTRYSGRPFLAPPDFAAISLQVLEAPRDRFSTVCKLGLLTQQNFGLIPTQTGMMVGDRQFEERMIAGLRRMIAPILRGLGDLRFVGRLRHF
jgi:hypothetical protein